METRIALHDFITPAAADRTGFPIPAGARLSCKRISQQGDPEASPLWAVYYGPEFCILREQELFANTMLETASVSSEPS